jgi:superfamily II DNA or RNA helicase
MSILIKVDDLSYEDQVKINKDLYIKIENKQAKFNRFKEIIPYKLENDSITVPFAFAVNELSLERKPRREFPTMKVDFTGTLREEQIEAKKEILSHLNKTGSVIASLHVGFGKTILAIYLASQIKMKTLIIVNKLVLMTQWEESIKTFCPDAKIQLLKPKMKLDDDFHFYIVNAINVEKFHSDFFNDIGCLIIDELHLIMAETLSRSMFHLSPRYLIGLSATPYREDGLDKLIEFYFGVNKVIRLLNRKHLVYKINSGFKPTVEKTSDGKLNWGSIIEQQSNNVERNELIIKICKKFSKNNILILTKRIEQGNYLYKRLIEEEENVTSLVGENKTFDRDARILIGTTGKCSTGFDFAKLDCLILACDLEAFFIQALGRILRRKDSDPIVFDIIDNNPVLYKHFETRKQVYLEVGGEIKNLNVF